MRPLLFALSLAFVAVPALAQGRLTLDAPTHTFGTLREGVKAEHVFRFTNTGDAPLRVLAVRPGCGCTTPAWTRDPLPPGGTGTITVVYDSANRPGPFRKDIVVTTDGTPRALTLYIEGLVEGRRLTTGYPQGNLLIDQDVVDLGTVAGAVSHTFRLQNNGERPVRLQTATAPSFASVQLPATPLFSGELAEVTVAFDAAALPAGLPFDVRVVVQSTDAEQPEKVLRLVGTRGAP